MNQNQALLEKLINDPSLLKLLEKMAKAAPAIKKEKKLKNLGNPSYVNKVTIKCKLCSTTHIKYICMSWDSEDKLYRSSCHHLDNIWPLLPVFDLIQRATSCTACPGILMQKSKEELIQSLIWLSNK